MLAHLFVGSFSHFSPTFTRQDRGHHYTAIFRSLQRCLIMFNFGLWLGHRILTEWSRSDSFVILAAEGHCLVGCLYTRFSSLHRATLELFHSDHWVLGHIAKTLLTPSLRLAILLPGLFLETSSIYRWWGPLCSLEPSMLQKFFCTLTQVCVSLPSCLNSLQTNPWLSLCSGILCQLWDLIQCRRICTFPNHAQSTQVCTGGLQSNWRHI